MKKILLAIALLITSGIYAASYNRPGIPNVQADNAPTLGGTLLLNGMDMNQNAVSQFTLTNDQSPLGLKFTSQGATLLIKNESGAGGGPFIDAVAASAVLKLGSDGIAAQPYAYLQGASSDSFIDLNGLIAGGSTLQGGNGGVELKTLGSGHISLLPSGSGLVKLGADLRMGGNDIVGDSADEILIDNDANSGGVRIISQGAALTVFNSSGPKIFATASGAELTLGGALGAGASLNVGTSQVVDLNTGVSGGVLVKGSGGVKIETSTGFPVEIASSNLTLPRDTTANRLDVNGNIRYNTTTDKFEGYEDGAWINIAGGGGSSPLTTKGDVYTYDTGDQRLAVGANKKVLTADSTQATGLAYEYPAPDAQSSGVITGGVLSVNGGDNTKFDITDGTGQIVDYWTTPGSTTITEVSWSGLTAQTVTSLGSQLITFVAIDSAGSIVQQAGQFSNVQTRENIVLGVLVHVNLTNLDTVNNEQQFISSPHNQMYDAFTALGFFNISGNVYEENGANLNMNKSVGDMWKAGSNYDLDSQDPHVRTLAALTALTFQYRFSDGSNGVTGIAIDPDNLDDGAGGLTALANNKWSIQRFYSFTSNNVKVQRGVTQFDSKDDAIAGLSAEPYVTEPSIVSNGLLRGFLVAKKGATDLSDVAEAVFLEAGKFGGSANASGAGSTSPLTTKGDLFGFSTGNAAIPVGSDGQYLVADSADAEGLTWKDDVIEREFIIDGGGSAITTGVKGTMRVPEGMTVTGWHAVSTLSGSIVIDVNGIAFGSYAGGSGGSSIAGSELPTISTAFTGSDTTITTWSDPVGADTILTFEVDSATTVEVVTISITMTKN